MWVGGWVKRSCRNVGGWVSASKIMHTLDQHVPAKGYKSQRRITRRTLERKPDRAAPNPDLTPFDLRHQLTPSPPTTPLFFFFHTLSNTRIHSISSALTPSLSTPSTTPLRRPPKGQGRSSTQITSEHARAATFGLESARERMQQLIELRGKRLRVQPQAQLLHGVLLLIPRRLMYPSPSLPASAGVHVLFG